mgnify:CR=1 FL=1
MEKLPEGLRAVPVIWTRQNLLQAAGFHPEGDVRKSLTRVREALNAMRGKRQPDHRIRLEAATLMFELGDIRPAPKEGAYAELNRPVAVAIVLAAPHAGAELSSHGIRLHLQGDGSDGEK